MPINKATAAQGTGPNRKKPNKEPVEKSTFVEQRTINRAFDDTLSLRRAHTVGQARQRLILPDALAVNALALHRYRRTSSDPPLPIAA